MIVVAIDIGGTFTDLIGFDQARGASWRPRASPRRRSSAGRHRLHPQERPDAAAIDELIHGSTIAINTLIERKGAKTGLIVTRGTRDVYIIGRGNRPEAYNLLFHRHRPLVPRHLTREVDERLLASGEVHAPLDRARRCRGCRALAAEGVEAVAVCFLHSYVNPAHERIAGEMIRAADAQRLSVAVARDPARVSRVRAHVDHGGERLYRPKVGGYVKGLNSSLGGHRFSRRALDHALERRRDDAGDRDRAARGDDGIRPGRRHHRLGAGRDGRSASPTSSPSTWAAPPPGEPDPRRRADHGAGLPCRRLCQRPSGDAADDRRGRGRRRRRLDRLARRRRRAEGGAAKCRRRPRPDLLSRRRRRADHHRRQRGARPARSRRFPRRPDEARCRGARRGIEKIAVR